MRKRSLAGSDGQLYAHLQTFAGTAATNAVQNAEEDMKIAQDKLLRCEDVSKRHGVASGTVRQTQTVVTASLLANQLAVLDEWLQVCRDTPPLSVHEVLKTDEATSRLKLCLDTEVGGTGDISSWHVVVCRRKIYLVFQDRVVVLEPIIPVVPATDTGGSTLHEALFKMSSTEKISAKIEELLRCREKVASTWWGIDGAYGGEKLYYTLEGATEQPMGRTLCCNHRNALVEGSLRTVCGKLFITRLFSVTNFVRMGGHAIRMIAALPAVLENLVVVKRGPAVASPFGAAVRDVMLSQYTKFKVAVEAQLPADEVDGRAKLKRSLEKYRAAWDRHLELWNGDWSRTDEIAVMVPRSQTVDRPQLLKSMSRSFVSALMARLPETPEQGKWTRLTPAIMWAYGLLACHGLLGHLLKAMSKHVKCAVEQRRAPEKQGEDIQELNWHEIAGTRLSASLAFAKCDDCHLRCCMLAVLLQPLSDLTRYFLQCSKENVHDCAIPVLDLLNDKYSPVVYAAQHVAAVAAGRSRHLVCVFAAYGCADWQTFFQRYPAKAQFVLSGARMASAGIYRRLELFRHLPASGLAKLVDGRRSAEERSASAWELRGLPECCQGPFLRRWFRAFPAVTDIMGEVGQKCIWGHVFALSDTLSIAEFLRVLITL